MEISSIMTKQTAQMQQTASLSILNTAMTTQAAGAVAMLETMNNQGGTPAPHPHKGHTIDLKG
ncbi:putative motility protein [Jeotgalibacillus sp. JSM ZJ347]|uniref:putative motility protein n=1 Tax=Jeotgalibacillus sp. JSM ZJ347 TaxID=3342117 RepID=UPI0035A81A7C